MAREHSPVVSDSGGARRTVAVLAVLLLLASALAPAPITASDGFGDRTSVVAAAGNTDGDLVANDGTTTVANDESVTIDGHVTDADGDPVANDAMVLLRADGNVTDENRTDERGRYELQGETDQSYDLTYRQGVENRSDAQRNESARDGIPAVYAVEQVNASSNLTRDVSLPRASVLNVTVVAENGTCVANATVRVTHANGSANATVTGRTDAQGRLTVDGRVGVEVAGTVTVAVEAPNASLSDATRTFSVENATEEYEREVVLGLNDTDPPTLDYDVSPNPVNVSESVTFDARDSTDESGIEETTWTVRGQPWDTRRMSASFPEPGNYSVELSATDWAGNENDTTVSVTVVDELAPEAALAVNATSVLTNESVRFDASNATENHRIAEYRWDFDGDGTPDRNTTDPVVTHAYDRNGTHDATVVVVDATGNRATATRQVTVELPPPVADFSVTDLEPDIGEQVTFDASPSTAAAGIANYTWTFEDGQQVPDERVFTTSFPDSGTYNVTLTVEDEQNRTDQRTRTIVVPNKPPAAEAGGNQSVIAGTEVSLYGNYSTDPDDDFSVRWNQTAGPTVTLSNASAFEPHFTAPEVNNTTLLRFELTATDDHGVTDDDSVTVTVAPQTKPNVSHEPADPAVGESVTFEVNRTGTYRWDFDGDGTPEATPESTNVTNATATHEFDAAGEYNVTLVDSVGREVVREVNVTRANESSTDGGNETTDSGNETTDSRNETTDGTGGGGGDSGGGSVGGSLSTGGSGSTGGAGGTGGTGGGSPTGSSVGDSTDGQSSSTAGAEDSGSDADSAEQRVADSDDGQSEKSSPSSVTVEQVSDGVLASVGASGSDPAEVRLPEEFAGDDSAFETVSVVPDGASNFSLSISPMADRPEGTPSPAANAVLSYLEVEKRNVTNAEIASARFRFRVAADALDEAGATPRSVTLYRYSGEKWTALATTLAGKENGTYYFEAISPGFSTFAIGLGTESDGTTTTTETTTRTGGSDDGGETTTTADSGDAENSEGTEDAKNSESGEDANSGESGKAEKTGQDSGVDSNTFLVGLFVAALVAAALWGYLLS